MTNSKEKKTWVTYLQRAGYVAAALVSIGSLIYGTANYFQSAEAADTAHKAFEEQLVASDYKANKDREEGDLRTQLELIDLKLEHEEDQNKRELLLQQRQIILNRLQQLQGADA